LSYKLAIDDLNRNLRHGQVGQFVELSHPSRAERYRILTRARLSDILSVRHNVATLIVFHGSSRRDFNGSLNTGKEQKDGSDSENHIDPRLRRGHLRGGA
jgi:hypothetical protein